VQKDRYDPVGELFGQEPSKVIWLKPARVPGLSEGVAEIDYQTISRLRSENARGAQRAPRLIGDSDDCRPSKSMAAATAKRLRWRMDIRDSDVSPRCHALEGPPAIFARSGTGRRP